MSCLKNIDKTITEQKDLYDITVLYQFKGKDFYYNDLFKRDIKKYINEAVYNECRAIVETFGAEVTSNRVRLIVRNNSEPKNYDERFVANAHEIFNTFATNIDNFDGGTNQYENLAKKLFHKIMSIKFKKFEKRVKENLVEISEEYTKRDMLDDLFLTFSKLKKSKDYEIISLIAALYVDLTKNEPFNENNEIINLFYLYALLYSNGFYMFKYVSFFEIYNLHRDQFKSAYYESQVNWERGYANAAPLAAVIRSILIEGYQKVDVMIRAKEVHKSNKKTDLLESTILRVLPDVFTKEMIRDIHPDVSTITIDRTLDRLQKENKIKSNGTGRSATWIRLEKIEEFNADTIKQMNLFDFDLGDEE